VFESVEVGNNSHPAQTFVFSSSIALSEKSEVTLKLPSEELLTIQTGSSELTINAVLVDVAFSKSKSRLVYSIVVRDLCIT
jgi:hypothetical protein